MYVSGRQGAISATNNDIKVAGVQPGAISAEDDDALGCWHAALRHLHSHKQRLGRQHRGCQHAQGHLHLAERRHIDGSVGAAGRQPGALFTLPRMVAGAPTPSPLP
jgi:hypothetical protein